MAKIFEAVAHNGMIVLPQDVPESARCMVTVLEEDLEALHQQAELEIPGAKQQRMSDLLLKNREEKLSEEEEAELDSLSAEYEATTLEKGRALSLLEQLRDD